MNENQLTTEAIGQRFLINLNTEWFKRCTLEQQTTINNNTEFNSQVFRFNSVLSLARDNICLHYPGHSNNKTTKFDTEISRFFMSASHLSVKHFKHKQHIPPFFFESFSFATFKRKSHHVSLLFLCAFQFIQRIRKCIELCL